MSVPVIFFSISAARCDDEPTPDDAKLNAETPLAANVTGNNPITLKATVNEQTKTLKCNECGGMNYPTEWYCERCGAELAAL